MVPVQATKGSKTAKNTKKATSKTNFDQNFIFCGLKELHKVAYFCVLDNEKQSEADVTNPGINEVCSFVTQNGDPT